MNPIALLRLLNKCAIITFEVITVENEEKQIEQPQQVEEKPKYTPRPVWQVWAARIGLVIMIVSVILYYIHIATGGMR